MLLSNVYIFTVFTVYNKPLEGNVVYIQIKTSGARFTKYLKPKIFLSAIQIVWHLRKS